MLLAIMRRLVAVAAAFHRAPAPRAWPRAVDEQQRAAGAGAEPCQIGPSDEFDGFSGYLGKRAGDPGRARPTHVKSRPTAAFASRRDVLSADIPSQGTMSARAVARLYAALLGHIDGVNLVSPERLQTMAAPAFSGTDQVMGFPAECALGYSPARLGSAQPRLARPSEWSARTAPPRTPTSTQGWR